MRISDLAEIGLNAKLFSLTKSKLLDSYPLNCIVFYFITLQKSTTK